MRLLLRISLALVALVLVAVIALAMLLPTWVESAGFRGEFQQFAQQSLGRTIEYGEVDIRFFPPRVEISDLRIGGTDANEPPAIQADTAGLELSWRALLGGRAVVDELSIEGAILRIVRTAEGIDLLAASVPAAPAASAASAQNEAPGGASPMALDRVKLRRATIVFDDRAVSPPVVWELSEAELEARPTSEGGTIAFELLGELGTGKGTRAQTQASGVIVLEGSSTGELRIRGLDAAPLRSYADGINAISGMIDLAATLEGPQTEVSLTSAALELAAGDLRLSGPVSASSSLRIDGETVTGPVTVNLDKASIDYGAGTFKKPAGKMASLAGVVTSNAKSGVKLDYKLTLHNINASGVVKTQPRLSVGLNAPSFDLTGWGELLPALASSDPSGTLALENLVYRGDPNDLSGSVALGAIRLAQPDAPPLLLEGFLDARGTALVPRELFVTAGGARFTVGGKVSDVFGDKDQRSIDFKLANPVPVESNTVFSLVEAMRDSVYGALVLDAAIVIPLDGSEPTKTIADRLRGDIRFAIGGDEAGGRLNGVSLLRSVFERFGALGGAALAALPAKRGISMEEYYSDKFDVARATFHIENGEAQTQDFEIVREKYTTRLRGGVRFSDLALDMQGELVIGGELDAALAGTETGTPRVIPLAHVGGTALDPSVSLNRKDVAIFGARYLLGKAGDLGNKLDKALGGGAGNLLRGVLDAAGAKE